MPPLLLVLLPWAQREPYHPAAINHDGLDVNVSVIELTALVRVLGFPVGDSTAEQFLHRNSSCFLGIVENIQGVVDLNSSHVVGDEAHLAGRSGDFSEFGDSHRLLGFFQPFGH